MAIVNVLLSKPVLDRGFDGIVRYKSKTSDSFFFKCAKIDKVRGNKSGRNSGRKQYIFFYAEELDFVNRVHLCASYGFKNT